MIDVDTKVQEITNSPIGCQFLLAIEASALSPDRATIPINSLRLAADSLNAMEWWVADHDEAVVKVLEHGERLKPLARTMLEHPATAWWFDPIDLNNQVWISHDKVAPDTANWQRPKSPPSRWERYAQKPRSSQNQYTSTLIENDTSLFVALDQRVGDLSPNPPKDTDGRREESGRGGEGATGEIAWVPFGVGRSADGLHRRTGAPMAVCGSCDARDGERIRSRELSRTGLARVCEDLRLSGGWVADGAVRPGVEWLAAGPRRG